MGVFRKNRISKPGDKPQYFLGPEWHELPNGQAINLYDNGYDALPNLCWFDETLVNDHGTLLILCMLPCQIVFTVPRATRTIWDEAGLPWMFV